MASMEMSLPEPLRDNLQCVRYFETWIQNESSIAFVPLAEILRENGFLEEARVVCERGLQHNGDSISGRLILASVYWSLDRKADAKSLASQILQRMPDHQEALKYISQPMSFDTQKAKDEPLHVDTQDLWQTSTMAEILVGQGEYEEAVRIFETLLSKEPENDKLRQRVRELEEMMSEEEKTVV